MTLIWKRLWLFGYHMLNLFANALEARFQDIDVVNALSILNSSNMTSRIVGCDGFGKSSPRLWVAKLGGNKTLSPLVNSDACRREFLSVKLQGTLKYKDKTFIVLWAMITSK